MGWMLAAGFVLGIICTLVYLKEEPDIKMDGDLLKDKIIQDLENHLKMKPNHSPFESAIFDKIKRLKEECD